MDFPSQRQFMRGHRFWVFFAVVGVFFVFVLFVERKKSTEICSMKCNTQNMVTKMHYIAPIYTMDQSCLVVSHAQLTRNISKDQ